VDTQTEVLLTHLPITDAEYARFQSCVREAIVKALKPNTCLITGHSESLSGVTDRVAALRSTVYRAC